MEGSLITSVASVVNKATSKPARAPAERVAIFFNTSFAPARVESSSRLALNIRATWLPTVPQPSIPTLMVFLAPLIFAFFHSCTERALHIEGK